MVRYFALVGRQRLHRPRRGELSRRSSRSSPCRRSGAGERALLSLIIYDGTKLQPFAARVLGVTALPDVVSASTPASRGATSARGALLRATLTADEARPFAQRRSLLVVLRFVCPTSSSRADGTSSRGILTQVTHLVVFTSSPPADSAITPLLLRWQPRAAQQQRSRPCRLSTSERTS